LSSPFQQLKTHLKRTLTRPYLRDHVINQVIAAFGHRSYLEIGVADGENINRIDCATRRGVDPLGEYALAMESDEYFAQYDDSFDCIFVDGLHHAEQVYRDIQQALEHLNPGGSILCHDLYPKNEAMQRVPREVEEWTGDCWRAWLRLRHERPDLRMLVIDTDYGVGLIRRGTQETLSEDFSTADYSHFAANSATWLNLKSREEFEEWLSENGAESDGK
jgi:SAM-dependent methyltransferase